MNKKITYQIYRVENDQPQIDLKVIICDQIVEVEERINNVNLHNLPRATLNKDLDEMNVPYNVKVEIRHVLGTNEDNIVSEKVNFAYFKKFIYQNIEVVLIVVILLYVLFT